ncbi:MAG: serine hydrolase, partial [Actinomycetota bacterium]|nr:serine hydrolase [Actinomycetota bacterium]
MISFRLLLSLLTALSLAACAGTNTVTTNSAVQEVGTTAPTTSGNAAVSTSEDAEVTKSEISTPPSSTVEQPAPTTTSGNEPASTEYEATKIPESFSEVTVTVENFVAEKNLNGAGLIVVDRDHGVRYHNHWGEFSTGRISLIASTSKVISAGVLVHLHDRGLLDLEAPIGDVVDYAGRLSTVTSMQLLSGSSGIPGLRADDPLYICMFLPTSSLQDCAIEGLSVAASDPRTVPPDTEFRYGGIQLQIA